MRRDRPRDEHRRPRRACRRAARRRHLRPDLRRWRRRHRPRRRGRASTPRRRDHDDDRRPPAQPVGHRAHRRRERVTGFQEKPRLDHWINGGFFFCEPALPRPPRRRPACSSASRSSASPPPGELGAYRHDGFWDCMDTYKDAVMLNDLWESGDPPWRVWDARSRDAGLMTALVTGGRGFVGAWLAKALLERGEKVVSLRPAAHVRAALGDRHARDRGRADPGRGRPRRRRAASRGCSPSTRSTPSSTSPRRRSSAPSRPRRSPASSRTCAAPGRCSRPASSTAVARVVVASSDKAYGAHDELPYREDFALQPTAPYEASKAAADLIARSYWHTYGLPVAVTRFANIYGGGDLNFSRLSRRRSAPRSTAARPVLRSDGSPERDFLYVEDAADAYLAIADALDRDEVRGEAFNAGGGRPTGRRGGGDDRAPRGTGVEPDIRGARQSRRRDRPPVRRSRRRS